MFCRCCAFLRKFFNPNVVRGRKGELAAVRYLKKQGFKILERNWQHGRYEIDIIAQILTCVIFIEVRGRSESNLQSGYDSVNRNKKRAISHAIYAYLSQHRCITSYRFDIISIQWDVYGKILNLHHYENVKLR